MAFKALACLCSNEDERGGESVTMIRCFVLVVAEAKTTSRSEEGDKRMRGKHGIESRVTGTRGISSEGMVVGA